MYKYQEEFAQDLTNEWQAGEQTAVRSKIRNLKNKAQAAYIASQVTFLLATGTSTDAAQRFAEFMHPNHQ